MRFVFGMRVLGSDGIEVGTLERVLLDPGAREVTHVVVGAHQSGEGVLLPLSLVQGNTDERLLLHAGTADVDNMPRYRGGRVDVEAVREPPDRHERLAAALQVPSDAVELGPRTRVATPEGMEGVLLGLAADEYVNRLTELLVSGLRDKMLLVPERWVGELRADTIALNATREQLEELVGMPAGQFITAQSGSPREVIEPGAQ